ncbi:MAG: hypothetical protein K6D02_02090 [Lachnospiraceae bacterium]|nr:hypothetical protein [Lachnospiraceae bacterium]
MKASMKKIVSATLAGFLALATVVTGTPTTADAFAVKDGAKKLIKKQFDPSGKTEYHAYFAMQTGPNYAFRNSWFDDYGKYDDLEGQKDRFDILNGWGTEETGNADELVDLDGKFQDVTIKGNGTYTVGVYDLNGSLVNGTKTGVQENFFLVFASTDIPKSAKDKIKFENIKFNIDGNPKNENCPQYFDPDALDDPGVLNLHIINTYNDEGVLDEALESSQMARDSISITFTVSGFDVDDPDANGEVLGEAKKDTSSASSAADTTSGDSESSSKKASKTPIIIGVCAAVVVVIIVVVVVATKKRD